MESEALPPMRPCQLRHHEAWPLYLDRVLGRMAAVTWLDDAVEKAEHEDPDEWTLWCYGFSPERFLALAEVVKAARAINVGEDTLAEAGALQEQCDLQDALARLDGLDSDV